VSSNGYLGSGLDLDLEAGALKRLHGDLHLVDATTTQHLAAAARVELEGLEAEKRRANFFLPFARLVFLFRP
jgi:hypothetical protein